MTKSRDLQIDGDRIRTRRLQLGWTQQELAERAGYCDRLIRKAERGEYLSPAASRILAETLSDDGYVFKFSEILHSERRAMDWISNELFGRHKSQQSALALDELKLCISSSVVVECVIATPDVPFGGHAQGMNGLSDWITTFRGCVVPVSEQESATSLAILEDSCGYLYQEVKLVSGNLASSSVSIHCNLQFQKGLLNMIRVHADSAEIVSFYKRINKNSLKQPRICHA